MFLIASSQVVNQKLLASEEPVSFLQDEATDKVCRRNGCDFSLKGNGTCDSKCDIWQCDYDGGDCKYKTCYEKRGCTKEIHGNGECDYACNNSDCDQDKGDCRNWN